MRRISILKDGLTETGRFSKSYVAADLWSASMILHTMLTGTIMYTLPCPSDINFRFFLLAKGLTEVNPLTQEIWNGIVDTETRNALSFRIRANASISSDAMDLLENLLAVRPSSRFSLDEAMESAWLGNSQASRLFTSSCQKPL